MKSWARFVLAILALILILCMGIWILETQTNFFQKTYDEVIMDNRNHYLSCDQLPSEAEVRKVMETHQDVIKKIEQINPGFVGVEMDTSTCPGRADILFWYGGHKDRLLIENILADDTFYGIPYRLNNR